MAKNNEFHTELLQAVTETLTAAQELLAALNNLRHATEADEREEPEQETQKSGSSSAGEAAPDTVDQSDEPRLYNHSVLVLASEANISFLVDQESAVRQPDDIVAIEFEIGTETPSHVILVLEAVLSQFPNLNRLVVDMQVAGESLKDILQLVTSRCHHVTSFSFKHLISGGQ